MVPFRPSPPIPPNHPAQQLWQRRSQCLVQPLLQQPCWQSQAQDHSQGNQARTHCKSWHQMQVVPWFERLCSNHAGKVRLKVTHKVRKLIYAVLLVFDIHMCGLQGSRHGSGSMVGHSPDTAASHPLAWQPAVCTFAAYSPFGRQVKRPASDCHANEQLAMVSGLCSQCYLNQCFALRCCWWCFVSQLPCHTASVTSVPA